MAPDFLIVGAGLAGAAAAAQLSRLGSVLIIEQGATPASEASAQNAGLIRRLDAEPCDRALAQRTMRFLVDEAIAWGKVPLSARTGAILGLVRDPLWLTNARSHLHAEGATVESIDPGDVPVLKDSPVIAAWHLPDERVCNGSELAKAMLNVAQQRGAQLHCKEAARALLLQAGQVVGVQTDKASHYAGHVVLAGGAWAQGLAQTAGIRRPLFTLRRTAAVVAATVQPGRQQPWIWLDDVGVYAKPESPHWLVSPCNEHREDPPNGPGSTGVPSTEDWRLTAAKVQRYFPALGSIEPVRSWTGLRTFVPDRRPLIGEDEDAPGLWWAGALGGSGLSTCWGVAEALTTLIEGRELTWLDPAAVNPSRPQLSRWPIFTDGDPQRARLIDG